SVVALAVALNRKPLAATNAEDDAEVIGRAVGEARRPDGLGSARKKAAAIDNPESRLRAYVELAAAGEAKADNPDLEAALRLAGEVKTRTKQTAWLKLRLAELAARAGVTGAPFDALVAAIDDRDLAA